MSSFIPGAATHFLILDSIRNLHRSLMFIRVHFWFPDFCPFQDLMTACRDDPINIWYLRKPQLLSFITKTSSWIVIQAQF